MKRRARLPQIALDRNSAEPLHRQLHAALRSAIRSGALAAGAALPSSRDLARQLGVSRNTVLLAFDELAAEGLVVSQTGSATRVCGQLPAVRLPDAKTILREAQYPVDARQLTDPDGNPIYVHR